MVAAYTYGWIFGIRMVYFYDQYGYRVAYDVRSKLNAKLSSVIKGKEWELLGLKVWLIFKVS